MSASVHELIGRILHPQAAPPASPYPRPAPARSEPVEVLIGRIINPPWAARVPLAAQGPPAPDGGEPPALEAPLPA